MRFLPVSALLLAAIVVLAGCPKGGDTATTSAEQEPVEEAPKSRFSGQTKAFVDGLTGQPIIGWMVADDGAPIVYDELSMAEDGTFSAKTTVRIGDEPFECTERGTWTLDDDKADSKTVGNLNFELAETDCAGRTAPKSWRAQATVSGDDVNFELR